MINAEPPPLPPRGASGVSSIHDADHVTAETVERVRFMNNAIAHRAVAGRLSKTEFIRWLLDENERLQKRLGQSAAMAPPIFPRR